MVSIPTDWQYNRNANPRFFRKHPSIEPCLTLLGLVLLSFLWMGCEDTTPSGRFIEFTSQYHVSSKTNRVIIPDANFRAKLKAKIPNAFIGDALEVDHVDVTELKKLDITSSSITSLEGIQYFKALVTLDCRYNQLTHLDLSKNTALTNLDCSTNRLAALDVSKNTALTFLDCSSNLLAALDVSQNTALTELRCYDNQLTGLDVSGTSALISLSCFNNRLTGLDVSQNTALVNLSCFNNRLAGLDVSQNPTLTDLICSRNHLTGLDVSQNPILTDLICSRNSLTGLDVSQNTALTTLNCQENRLTDLDIRGMRTVKVLIISAGVTDNRNPIDTLKVHDSIKQHDRMKEVKATRGTNVIIEVYTADNGITTYTRSCADYDPNDSNGKKSAP